MLTKTRCCYALNIYYHIKILCQDKCSHQNNKLLIKSRKYNINKDCLKVYVYIYMLSLGVWAVDDIHKGCTPRLNILRALINSVTYMHIHFIYILEFCTDSHVSPEGTR